MKRTWTLRELMELLAPFLKPGPHSGAVLKCVRAARGRGTFTSKDGREVAATVEPLIAKNGNSLVVDCPPETGHLRADLTKVRQVLFNLLSNAAKFTERGTIRLEVRRVPPGALGVEPADSDRGRLRELKVKVTQPGVTVRSRLWVSVPKKTS